MGCGRSPIAVAQGLLGPREWGTQTHLLGVLMGTKRAVLSPGVLVCVAHSGMQVGLNSAPPTLQLLPWGYSCEPPNLSKPQNRCCVSAALGRGAEGTWDLPYPKLFCPMAPCRCHGLYPPSWELPMGAYRPLWVWDRMCRLMHFCFLYFPLFSRGCSFHTLGCWGEPWEEWEWISPPQALG